jgi:signal transduction histidine kinase/DNA-binding response OmpR family regulator
VVAATSTLAVTPTVTDDPDADPVEHGGSGPGSKTNILIVDDSPDKLLVFQAILEELGENVVCVNSGAEALKRVLEQEFAVVLLDVKMADMDGFETAALIRGRKKCAHTPIIFVTAYEDEMHTAEGYSLGAVDYILTPVMPDVLRSKVRVFVQLFRLRDQIARQADERIALMREQAARAVAEESIRRSVFLADASRALLASLDVAETAQALAAFVVPSFADLCAVGLVGDSAESHRMAAAWVGDGPPYACVEQAVVRGFADGPLADATNQALTRGQPYTLELPIETVTLGFEPQRQVRLGFGLRHVTVFPLLARGHRLGALVLGSTAARALGEADRAVAIDLAARTAIALDNALLYSRIHENDQRKDEFLAMLAHELRNPLAPIRNALTVLRRVVPQEGLIQRSQDILDRQVEQLTRMVDDLLDVSRLMQGKIRLQREHVTLSAVLDRAFETARPWIESRQHHVTVDVPSTPLPLDGDSVRLSQVFANLLNNAAKYTPAGGRITVVARQQADQAVVRVTDNGSGIPPEVLPHVFDLFTQANRSLARSEGGLGIGLTVVRRLLEKHGGSVEAKSAGPGAGSEFVVRLPLSDKSPSQEKLPAGTATAENPGALRVLLIDDNADASEALETLLRLEGQEVRQALDGMTALEIAREFKPQLVLCDLGLPGMDGYEVIRCLREQAGDVMPVVAAVTGYARAEDRRRTREAGFDYHLAKPIGADALRALLAAEARRFCGRVR